MKGSLLFLLLGIGLLESQSLGQEVLRIHDGVVAFDTLSRPARIKDLDGDTVDDYLLGAPGMEQSKGAVIAISGVTGAELFRIAGIAYGGLGAAVGAGERVDLEDPFQLPFGSVRTAPEFPRGGSAPQRPWPPTRR